MCLFAKRWERGPFIWPSAAPRKGADGIWNSDDHAGASSRLVRVGPEEVPLREWLARNGRASMLTEDTLRVGDFLAVVQAVRAVQLDRLDIPADKLRSQQFCPSLTDVRAALDRRERCCAVMQRRLFSAYT